MTTTIQCTRLGRMGRFGNRLFQSAFMVCYARMHSIDRTEAPLFEFQDHFPIHFSPVTRKLPDVQERWPAEYGEQSGQLPPDGSEYVERDFIGYAQFHTSWYRAHKEMVQALWTPKLANTIASAMNAADPGCKTRVGIHYRAGDFENKGNQWRVPRQWYLNWLGQNWDLLASPRLFVAAEDPRIVDWFAGYEPLTCRSMGLNYTYIDEWTMLRACDVLLVPNSTFGMTAAMANPMLMECWRASLPDNGFKRIDPWDCHPLSFDRAENYPGVLDPL